jgi:hypothetical protein
MGIFLALSTVNTINLWSTVVALYPTGNQGSWQRPMQLWTVREWTQGKMASAGVPDRLTGMLVVSLAVEASALRQLQEGRIAMPPALCGIQRFL